MARRGSNARDIELEIRAKIASDAAALAELDKANAAAAEQAKAEVQSHIPVVSGRLVGSIQIKKLKRTETHPLPGRVVYSDSARMHLLEYGTKADPAGTENPRAVEVADGEFLTMGPDTPTEAVAPFGKARARLGKTIR